MSWCVFVSCRFLFLFPFSVSFFSTAFRWLCPFYVHCSFEFILVLANKKFRNFTLVRFSDDEVFVQNQPIWLDTMATIPFSLLNSEKKKNKRKRTQTHTIIIHFQLKRFDFFCSHWKLQSYLAGNWKLLHIPFPKGFFPIQITLFLYRARIYAKKCKNHKFFYKFLKEKTIWFQSATRWTTMVQWLLRFLLLAMFNWIGLDHEEKVFPFWNCAQRESE